MKLPKTVREAILDEIDTYVETVDEPDSETVVEYVLEQLELAGEDLEKDDLIGELEESGGLDGTLAEALADAFDTTADFVFTGEEVLSTLEELCAIKWKD